MILPRLCIKGKQYSIELYDVEYPDEPLLMIGGNSIQMCESFFYILNMALDNYDEGYSCGYEDAMTDLENESQLGV